ncbi:MAG: aminotransferase class I/II-fold pyridoxal phosphate-dependent enzyme [Victivallaceae bacterium]|nr:aminotransferase class I/II-fold pyridoxal phosphate-dependent enzyme [Victivallaceae bacterium]
MNGLKFHPSDRIAEHVKKIPRSGIREFFELVVDCDDDVISLGVGEPDFVTPWVIRESAIYSLDRGHTSYTSNQGLLSLRKEICNYVNCNFGVNYIPETECLVTVGVSEALDLAMRALVNPGDEVLYSEPCYVSYGAEIRLVHGVPVVIENTADTEFSPDIGQLKAAITPKTKILMLNFPCNPTGATLRLEQMEEIAAIAVKNDLIVFTDEIYSELSYVKRLPTIASLPGMRERTVFLHGFSKAFAMTGFRIGYACGPAEIIAAMNKIHQYTILCAPIMAQEAAEEALKNGLESMEKMRREYQQRRDFVVNGFNEIGLKCLKPKGAFYVFPSIKSTGLSSREFATRLLQEQKVAVVPGTAFGACGEGYIRCCYAASYEELAEALKRIKIFIEDLKR